MSSRLEKAHETQRNKLTRKQKAFAEKIVETRNGTASALAVYDTDSPNVAGAIASENLQKPKIREEIERLIEQNGINLMEIVSIHARNARQSKHLPTSQKAVTDFYELLGMKQEGKGSEGVKIAFIIER